MDLFKWNLWADFWADAKKKRSLYDRFGEAGLRGEYDGYGTGFQDVRLYDTGTSLPV